MKVKKIVAFSLVFFLILGVLPEKAFGSSQRPIQEFQRVTIEHGIVNSVGKELSIVPKVKLDWVKPKENYPYIGDTPVNEVEGDGKLATYYEFRFNNVHDTSNSTEPEELEVSKINEDGGVLSINAEKVFKDYFKNGALYEAQIIAKHKHWVKVGNQQVPADAPLSGENIPKKYFITDFDLRARAGQGLTFEWEYIPGVTYYLFYEKGNKLSIDEMTGAGETITPEKAKGHLSEDQKKVVYTVEEATAGQIYSAYILPIGIENAAVSFSEIFVNTESPKLIHVTPNIELKTEPLGESKVRLSWDINQAAWVSVENKLYQTVIWQIDSSGRKVELGRIHNDNNGNKDVGYFECTAPNENVTYQVEFLLKNNNGEIESGFSAGPKEYIPDALKEVPYTPFVPEFFPYKPSDVIIDSDFEGQDKYKVKYKGDTISNLDKNNISEFRKNTFNYEVKGNEADVQLVWQAISKSTSDEIDYDLYYDIWVSEDPNTFDREHKIVDTQKIDENNKEELVLASDGKTVVGMKKILKGLKTNKTYYIKIVSKHKYSETDYMSSLPNVIQINIEKVGDSFEPPVVGKPPLQLQNTSKDSLTLAWANKWYEVLASKVQANLYQDATEKKLALWGHSRVYKGSGDLPIRYRDDSKTFGEPIDLYGSTVQSKIDPIRTFFEDGKYILNAVSMGEDTHYKMKVYPQAEVEGILKNKYPDISDKSEALQEWVMSIDQSEVKNTWIDVTEEIKDTTLEGVSGKSITVTNDSNGEKLKPNTAYVVLISAAREIEGEWKYSIVPSYILGTTGTDHESNLENPTTPRLYNYEKTDVRDTEISVRWIYNSSFEYELVYSRLDDPDNAEVYEFTEDDKKTFVNGAEAYVTIAGLLPETTYNFWLRAKQKAEVAGSKVETSDWSTPVTSTTLTLANPLPPSGLGKAAYQSIQEAGKDFQPISDDHIAVEWMRNASDLANKDKRMTYSYVVQIADNPQFLDETSVEVGGENKDENKPAEDKNDTEEDKKKDEEAITYEILSKSLVNFSNLRANRPYYFRVKTVLNFVDGDKKITKESEFTSYIKLISSKSNNEYDGGGNPNVVEYDKPIEQTYKNDIWTYELVDAAKITTGIVNDKNQYYTITMENYKNKYDALTRRVKMPMKIIQTLSNQGMSLRIQTNIGIYEIPGQSLKHYIADYQGVDSLQIDLSRKSATDIALYVRSSPEQYQSGEKLDITLRGSNKKTTINTLDHPMRVKLKIEAPGAYNYSSYKTYLYNYAVGEWQEQSYKVDMSDNSYLVYSTLYTGLNALYLRTVSDSNSNSSYIMNALSSMYNVSGLGSPFTQNSKVGASQYVTLMLGLAKNSKQINLIQGASEADYKAAKSAGIYSGGQGNVTREQALAGVVKLYEIKHGNKIKASNMNFPGVSAAYSEAVSKAYAIGMIENMTNSKGYITYGELCDWIALAIE